MKRILGSGYVKKIDSSGTDNILVETIKDLHPAYRDKRFPIQNLLNDGPIDAFEHYNFTFKFKIPNSLLHIFKYYRVAVLTELPEIELNGYIPPVFLKDGQKITVMEDNELHTKFNNFYKNLFNFFNKLYEQKIATHQLEYILPYGRMIEFYLTMNLSDLMLFLRTNLGSEVPEAKEIAQAMLEYFKEEFPLLSSIFLEREFPPRTV